MTAAISLPVLWMGYGTDLDIGDVLATAAHIRDLDYTPSRNPGVPVVEAIVAVLDPIGGHVLVNLATAAAMAATVVGIARLVRLWGHPNGDLVALAFLASPVVIIAGTQTADFLWATAFLTWGALALVRGRPVPAGVLLALAVGSRSSTLLLVVALLAAVAWDRPRRRAVAAAAGVAVPIAVLLFVPAWLSHDRSLGFLDATDGWVSLPNNLARFLLKNYAVAGLALVVVLVVAAPALLRALRRWDHDPMVRFAVLGLLATEALFLRMPWKPAHLVPCLLALVLWIGASDRNRRPFLWVVVAAMAVNGLVVFRPFVADEPNSTGGGDLQPAVTLGWLANDIRCRSEHMDQPPELGSGAWGCTLEPMRGPAERHRDSG
ncbi:MAG TPA: glycosyltransferase 87 family protein [Acidimicrobiales bacterium]